MVKLCVLWDCQDLHRALSGVLAPGDFVTQSFICGDFSWFGEALRIVKPAVICESSVHCGGAKICTELCPGYLPQRNFATQSLGCRIFAWFGEALCIVKSAKTCGKLCVLDVAQSLVRGTCPRGILQHRAWVAGFLPGLAKLCVLWGCPNLNGALCFVEPAGIFRKLCAFSCS